MHCISSLDNSVANCYGVAKMLWRCICLYRMLANVVNTRGVAIPKRGGGGHGPSSRGMVPRKMFSILRHAKPRFMHFRHVL